jgi:hypothetical protein
MEQLVYRIGPEFAFSQHFGISSKRIDPANQLEGKRRRMHLDELLGKHRATLVKRWFDTVVETYPADSRQFIKSQKDLFANPVGQTTLNSLRALFDALLQNTDRKAVAAHLDPVVRIRAVQEFTPSQAVGFVLELKGIIAEQLGRQLWEGPQADQWQAMQARIDAMGLMAFDIYMQCREKLSDLKVNLERDRIYKAMTRAGLIATIDEQPTTGVNATQPEPMER